MKTNLSLIVATLLCLAFGLSCNKTPSEPGDAPVETKTSEKIGLAKEDVKACVVYFSATGTTKAVAEKIAEATDAQIFEIIPKQIYTEDDLNYRDEKSRSSIETNDPNARPEIEGEPLDLSGFNVLYLGYPIWWGEAPKILYTFVERQNFDGLIVVPFCTSGSSETAQSAINLAKAAGSGKWLDGRRFDAKADKQAVDSWINEIQ